MARWKYFVRENPRIDDIDWPTFGRGTRGGRGQPGWWNPMLDCRSIDHGVDEGLWRVGGVQLVRGWVTKSALYCNSLSNGLDELAGRSRILMTLPDFLLEV